MFYNVFSTTYVILINSINTFCHNPRPKAPEGQSIKFERTQYEITFNIIIIISSIDEAVAILVRFNEAWPEVDCICIRLQFSTMVAVVCQWPNLRGYI